MVEPKIQMSYPLKAQRPPEDLLGLAREAKEGDATASIRLKQEAKGAVDYPTCVAKAHQVIAQRAEFKEQANAQLAANPRATTVRGGGYEGTVKQEGGRPVITVTAPKGKSGANTEQEMIQACAPANQHGTKVASRK